MYLRKRKWINWTKSRPTISLPTSQKITCYFITNPKFCKERSSREIWPFLCFPESSEMLNSVAGIRTYPDVSEERSAFICKGRLAPRKIPLTRRRYVLSKRRHMFKHTLHTVTTQQKVSLDLTVVYSKNHKKKVNTVCGEDADKLNIMVWAKHGYQCALNGQ